MSKAGSPRRRSRSLSLNRLARLAQRLRTEAGFSSMRAFYDAQGGRKTFGCSYRAYAAFESGEAAAHPRLLERFALAMRLESDPERAREFSETALRVLLGSEDFAALALRAFEAPYASGRTPGGSSGPSSPRTLTEKESQMLLELPENYWTFTLLANDDGSWDLARMEEVLRFPADKLKRAASRLERAGLIKRDARGGYRCAPSARLVSHPEALACDPAHLRNLENCWKSCPAAPPETLMELPMLLRVDEKELRGVFPYLIHTLHAADAMAVRRKGTDTGIFAVDVSVRRLLPF